MSILALSVALLAGCHPPVGDDTHSPAGISCPTGETLMEGDALNVCVRLDQLDVADDVDVRPDSEWGLLTVRFLTHPDPVYLTASIDGSLRVDNLALLSTDSGAEQVVSVAIRIADTDGLDVTRADVGVSVGTTPGGASPAPVSVPVGATPVALASGEVGTPADMGNPDPGAVGAGAGAVEGSTMGLNPDLPNQECRLNWCVPCAVSNSLQFLAAHHGTTFPNGTTTIEYWGEILGTTERDGTELDWPTKKDAKLAALGVKVRTTTTTDPAAALDAVRRGCDVELRASGHVAAISAMAKNADGSYTIHVKHDILQNQPGGLVHEAGLLRDGQLTGLTWLRSLYGFTMECPTD